MPKWKVRKGIDDRSASWSTVGRPIRCCPRKSGVPLRLKPKRAMVFTLADGTEIRRKVSEYLVRLDHEEGHSPVVLGEGSDEALLGVVTLENLGLVLNPFDRTLRPMRAMLPRAAVVKTDSTRHPIEGSGRRPRQGEGRVGPSRPRLARGDRPAL